MGKGVPGFDWVRPVPIKTINQWAAVSSLWAGEAKKITIILPIRPKSASAHRENARYAGRKPLKWSSGDLDISGKYEY